MIIAIDGPAASGKGTIARGVANELRLKHLDSGLFYRAYTDLTAELDLIPENQTASYLASKFDSLDEETLRDEYHATKAAHVATDPVVRERITDAIRIYADNVTLFSSGIVIDGRDIGTVVFPSADAKLFVTANVEARAKRRFDELAIRGRSASLAEVADDLARRDERDANRISAPLRQAPDALVLDNSALDRNQSIAEALRLIRGKVGRKI